MDLDAEDDDELNDIQPLCAVIVLKALNSDGRVCYLSRATTGLTSVEALAMVRYAQLKLEHGLLTEMEDE
jgi:hypothetical protein